MLDVLRISQELVAVCRYQLVRLPSVYLRMKILYFAINAMFPSDLKAATVKTSLDMGGYSSGNT